MTPKYSILRDLPPQIVEITHNDNDDGGVEWPGGH